MLTKLAFQLKYSLYHTRVSYIYVFSQVGVLWLVTKRRLA